MTRELETFFATCAPGLEAVLHEEARELRLAKLERQVGGVYFRGKLADACRANLWLRTAVRVLWRVARFPARDADALYRGVSEIDWRRFVRPEGSLVVDAQTKESALDHSLFIEQRTKDAIVDQLAALTGKRPSVDKESPDLPVHVHISRDRCTVSIDTSGESLHKRGWRRFQGTAPLAETLAAGMVLLSKWDRRAPLVDPFAGSGTILIEAALIARNVAPGLSRPAFAFERLPGHDARAWERLKDEARRASLNTPRKKLILRGAEKDAATHAGAIENLRSAGFEGELEIERCDALDLELKRGWNAWIVTNPPYGERVGDEAALRELYHRFAAHLRERASGYHVALLSGNPRLARALGFDGASTMRLFNGAIECDLLQWDVP